MFIPLKKFRGQSKPPGQPRIDWALAPRGLKLCLPFADAAMANVGPFYLANPAHIGSTVTQVPTVAGSGVRFSNVSGGTNSVGYQTDFTSNFSLEILFISGPTINSLSICMYNQSSDGTNVTEDKGFYFDSSSRLNGYVFSGGATPVTDVTTTYAANTLYHAILVGDGVHATLYLNGKQVAQVAATSSFTGYSNPAFWVFGAVQTSSGTLASNITMLLANYSSVPWSPTEIELRASDPFNFLIFPEDDILATIVGASTGPGTQNITLSGIASTNAFGTMQLGMNIQLAGLPSTNAFGNMVVGPNIQLTGIANVNHFGVMSLGMNITLTGIASTAHLGVPSLIPVVPTSITLTGIAPTSSVGTPGIRDPESANLFGIPSTNSYGNMTVTQQAIPTNSLIDTNIPYEWVDSSENFQLYLYLLSVMNTIRTKDEAVIFVTGNPNGVVSAKPGTIALNKNGGTGNTIWSKETGLGNTGWVNVA